MTNLITCLKERIEANEKFGGSTWKNDIKELINLIKLELNIAGGIYSKYATQFEIGNTIMINNQREIGIITDIKQTTKMMTFEVVDMNGNLMTIKRNKSTMCCYR